MTMPQLVTKDQGQTVSVTGQCYKLLVGGEHTNHQFAAFECLIPPGGGTPHHIHQNKDETFYVLKGEFKYTVGKQTLRGKAGDFLWAPRNIQLRVFDGL